MPTYEREAQFNRDYRKLSREQKAAIKAAVQRLVADLRSGSGFRRSLRVKAMQGHKGVYEMTWAPEGRATFEYGAEVHSGEPHIIWRRIGGHEILAQS